jgi:hypothetical protein
MVLFLSFVALALARMVVASPLERASSPIVPLSAGVASINSIDESSHIGPIENVLSSRELGMESTTETKATMACSDISKSRFIWAS